MTTLRELVAGDRARIVGLAKQGSHYRRKLLAMGLTPTTALTVVRVAPMGDPIEIQTRGCHVTLRREQASLIHVEKL